MRVLKPGGNLMSEKESDAEPRTELQSYTGGSENCSINNCVRALFSFICVRTKCSHNLVKNKSAKHCRVNLYSESLKVD